MDRLELGEREIVLTQSAEDRRNGVWHCWTNDNFNHRRLERIGAKVVEKKASGTDYELDVRQVLFRKIPAQRKANPHAAEYLKRARGAGREAKQLESSAESAEE